MASKRGRAWKMERASVHTEGSSPPRSNKYAADDGDERPEPGSRERIWVGGYTRSDGTAVKGYYRAAPGKA